MSHKPYSVARILNTTRGNLEPLLERAYFLQTLTLTLRETLDPALASHVTFANLRDNTAVMTADTPAWLTQLRYQAPTILQQLRQQPGLENLRRIQFRVQPAEHPADTPVIRYARRSQTGAQVLESAAKGTTDPKLAAALQRLSHRTRTPPEGKR
jgi:hypothetical protein